MTGGFEDRRRRKKGQRGCLQVHWLPVIAILPQQTDQSLFCASQSRCPIHRKRETGVLARENLEREKR
jgi:hypothetical protein